MDLSSLLNNCACDCGCPSYDYNSQGFSAQAAALHVPSISGGVYFTATDYSQQLACGFGREVSFSAFALMGSSLATAAEAMIVLALNQCNAVLNQNEALISQPAASASSTTTTTVYHETVTAGCGCNIPTGATDEYIYNYTGADGKQHESITYVNKDGKEVGKQDFVIGGITATSGTLEDSSGKTLTGATAANGDLIKIGTETFYLKDTGNKDANGKEIFNLDLVSTADGKTDTGVSVGTITFSGVSDSTSGALTISSNALVDYDSNQTSANATAINDALKVLTGTEGTVSTAPTDANYKDGYALYEASSTSTPVTLTEASASTAYSNSTTTSAVSSSTADPLTTMAAVFKYAEVYAEAMTMISTYYQNNIDDFKDRPH